MTPAEIARFLVDEARALGFQRVGFAPLAPAARHEAYRTWLADGRAAGMTYLGEPDHVEPRRDPRALLEGARTLVVVALSYGAGAVPIPAARLGAPRGKIARYALGEDYHLVLKQKLEKLGRLVAAKLGRPIGVRSCVDTAPLLERDAAEAAGLGFVAKNTMLIAPGLGSTVVLGELLLDVDAAPEAPAEPVRRGCGECTACLDACPTRAFAGPYVLDAGRCISYLTIEHRGAIPRELRPAVGAWIFGCDICQDVCPWNETTRPPAPELAPRTPDHGAPELIRLLELGTAQLRKLAKRSALRRVGRAELRRNICVALGNAGDPAAIPALRVALLDRFPLVRGHAAWALGCLGDHDHLRARRSSGDETDDAVLEELDAALA